MRKYKAALVLMVIVLLTAIGAKQYSTITMGDNEWIGLGANAGRIVFDDQAKDEVIILDANLGIGDSSPGYDLDILDTSGMAGIRANSTAGDAYIVMDSATGEDGRLYWREGGSSKWGFHYYAPQDYLRLYSYGAGDSVADFLDTGDINLVPNDGFVGIKDSTPSYELDVNGDIRATDVVRADTRIEIGTAAEPFAADGAMPISIDAGDHLGGYFLYSAVVTDDVHLTGQYEHDVAVIQGVYAEWIAVDSTTGIVYTGHEFLECDPQGSYMFLADGAGASDLILWMSRGGPPNDHNMLKLLLGDHDFRVILRVMFL